MKITAITPQTRNPERVSVFVDDEFALGLALEVAVRSGLRVGQEVTEQDLVDLGRDEERARAMERALGFLAYRARSEKEIRDRLFRYGYEDDLVELTIERLRRLGYVNDEVFASLFIRDRLNGRAKGRRAILGELRRKGVDPELAEHAFDAVAGDRADTETDRALEVASRWTRGRPVGASREERERAKRRLWGHLARRGFSSEAIRLAVSQAFAA